MKTEVEKEFLISLFEKKISTEEIKVKFPELFKPKFEVGRWWKYKDEYYRISYIEGNYIRIDCTNRRGCTYFTVDSIVGTEGRYATEEEIKAHLVSLLETKGFKDGVKFKKGCFDDSITTFDKNEIEYYHEYCDELDIMFCNGMIIYQRGKFAEIIEEEKPKPKEIEFVEWMDQKKYRKSTFVLNRYVIDFVYGHKTLEELFEEFEEFNNKK